MLRRRFVCQKIQFTAKWFAKPPVVARLAIPRLIVGHAKQPAADIFLRAMRGEVALQTEKGVLHNVLGFVKAEMNAEFRRQIAKWTYEAMERKARAGHVTGGRVFGYDNVRVDGHVERRINEGDAFLKALRNSSPSKLAKRLAERGVE